MKTTAERLLYARKQRGWTQTQLAVAAEVTQGTIGHIESGARQSRGSLPKIAKALGVSHDWLADGEGEMVLAGSRVEPPNIVTLPPARRIVDTLDELQAVVGQLSPLLQDAGRSVLHKWMDGQVSAAEAAATLEGLQQASAGLVPAAENRAA